MGKFYLYPFTGDFFLIGSLEGETGTDYTVIVFNTRYDFKKSWFNPARIIIYIFKVQDMKDSSTYL